jgi:DNA-binding LytR/AlgR family response regulator
MKISCIIVEDLKPAADFLKKYCTQSGLLDVQGEFTNVKDALEFLNQQVVDLIFLDVEMPDATGFDLMDQLCYSPKIIMTTSKTEYAFDAYRYEVADYLKKPFTYPQFLKAVQKIQAVITTLPSEQTNEFYIKADAKLIKLKTDDILFIESMGDYVKFITLQKNYISLYTIKSLEEKLNKHSFLKVHRSYLVNTKKINDLQGNTLYIQGHQVPISKAHKEEIIQRLKVL